MFVAVPLASSQFERTWLVKLAIMTKGPRIVLKGVRFDRN
jgi:hypothetical protein